MSNGWGGTKDMYPQVVGHEIVGKVVRVGKDVKHLKVGDVAGVGAQCDSCMECENCKKGKLISAPCELKLMSKVRRTIAPPV
jgi:alcohol dehydrogenase (NADP+)